MWVRTMSSDKFNKDFKEIPDEQIEKERIEEKITSDTSELEEEKMNDEKEEGNLRYGIYKQPLKEGVVAYRIEGLFKEDDFKVKNRFALKKDPPVLIIEDDKGVEASFSLTENVSIDLEKSLKVLNRGYLGIQNRRKKRIKDIFTIHKNWREWPVDTILLFLCFIALLVIK